MATRIIHIEFDDGEERIHITEEVDAPVDEFIIDGISKVVSDTVFQQDLPSTFPNNREFKIS